MNLCEIVTGILDEGLAKKAFQNKLKSELTKLAKKSGISPKNLMYRFQSFSGKDKSRFDLYIDGEIVGVRERESGSGRFFDFVEKAG